MVDRGATDALLEDGEQHIHNHLLEMILDAVN